MKIIRSIIFPLILLAALPALPAHAWLRTQATTFATLPLGAGNPEALTVDEQGNVYVTTFAGELLVFSGNGRLLRALTVAPASGLLLDIKFHPLTGALLVVDFGAQQLLEVDPFTGSATVFATIPGGAAAGPNVMTFDGSGNVYVSDSFQGVIWRTGPSGGAVSPWVSDPLLTTTGFPPFGANGLAFNHDASALFVANTGEDSIVKIPVDDAGIAGAPEVFVNAVNGPDGLIIDEHDNIWVAANQANEVVVLDPSGRMIAALGDFGGIDSQGAVVGLLFPSSLVRSGEFIYVTNFALDLRGFGLTQSTTSQWAAQVTRHTVVKLRAIIPPVRGLP